MKKSIIPLSIFLLSFQVIAATHVSHEVVTEAHKTADVAKEKLHEAQDKDDELKLESKHAVEGESDSISSKVSEESQKVWHATKQDAEKAWDKTKQGAEDLKNKVSK